MTITLAFTNESNYLTDIDTAILKGKATVFTIDVANTSPLGYVSGTPLQSQILDGSKWELPVLTRQKQQIQTHANLLLAGMKVKSVFYTYRDLLRSWWYAKARWVKTDDLTTTANKAGLVKIVRGNEELAFEEVEGISWAIHATIDFETAGVSQTPLQ